MPTQPSNTPQRLQQQHNTNRKKHQHPPTHTNTLHQPQHRITNHQLHRTQDTLDTRNLHDTTIDHAYRSVTYNFNTPAVLPTSDNTLGHALYSSTETRRQNTPHTTNRPPRGSVVTPIEGRPSVITEGQVDSPVSSNQPDQPANAISQVRSHPTKSSAGHTHK